MTRDLKASRAWTASPGSPDPREHEGNRDRRAAVATEAIRETSASLESQVHQVPRARPAIQVKMDKKGPKVMQVPWDLLESKESPGRRAVPDREESGVRKVTKANRVCLGLTLPVPSDPTVYLCPAATICTLKRRRMLRHRLARGQILSASAARLPETVEEASSRLRP